MAIPVTGLPCLGRHEHYVPQNAWRAGEKEVEEQSVAPGVVYRILQ